MVTPTAEMPSTDPLPSTPRVLIPFPDGEGYQWTDKLESVEIQVKLSPELESKDVDMEITETGILCTCKDVPLIKVNFSFT
jgi:hypothetical protein